MIDATIKSIKGISYWIDYPYESAMGRYDSSSKKFYIKPYGDEEYEVDDNQSRQDFMADILLNGSEINEEDYKKGKPNPTPSK